MERGDFSHEQLPENAPNTDELIDRNDRLAHFVLSKLLELIRNEDDSTPS